MVKPKKKLEFLSVDKFNSLYSHHLVLTKNTSLDLILPSFLLSKYTVAAIMMEVEWVEEDLA